MSGTAVIVGAGQAGGWAAVALREAGFKGPIVLVGEETHEPYERPILSKKVLTAAELPAVPSLQDASRYDKLGIELVLGRVVGAIDPRTRRLQFADGGALEYRKLLLATGGRARRLPIKGGEHALCLRTWEDALKIRERLSTARKVVAIGAGVIGLEIASSACAVGCEVTVLEAGNRPMGRCLSQQGIEFLTSLHYEAGVELRLRATIESIVRERGSYRLQLKDGSSLEADCVVAGIGMERNTGLAEAAGLAVENGILVDEFGRTSLEGVYAAGDVAAFWQPALGRHVRLESWRHAQNHGLTVGRSMAGERVAYDELPWFWTEQHGVNLQVAGTPSATRRTVVRGGGPPGTFCAFDLDVDARVIAVTTANQPKAAKAGQMLIRSGRPVAPAALADSSTSLQQLVAVARKAVAE